METNTKGYLVNSAESYVNYDIIVGNCCHGNEHNDTDEDTESVDTGMVITFLSIELVLTTASLAANGLVLMAFGNNKHLRSNVTNFYLLQLSLANFLMGIVSVLHIVATIAPDVLSNDYGCLSLYASMLVVCGYSSLSLIAISYDRFLAIAGPLYYRTRICKRRVLVHCLLIYSIPSVLFLLVPFLWKDTLDEGEMCNMVAIFHKQYLAFFVIPFYLIITTILILLFVITVYLNRRRMRTIQKLIVSMPFNWKRNSAHKRSGRLTRTSGLVLASFLLCWLPLFINLTAQVYGGVSNPTMHLVSLIAFLPILFNSALTPMLYVYRLSTFRTAIKKMFCKDQYLQEKREYETTRLLQRRNAIRHIRDSYDSVTVFDSMLYTSQVSDESELESSICDIPAYESVRTMSRRQSAKPGELWVNEQTYPLAVLENGNSCRTQYNLISDTCDLESAPFPMFEHEDAKRTAQRAQKTHNLIVDGCLRRHSSPHRKAAPQTAPEQDFLGNVVIENELRRGSSPEFRGQALKQFPPTCLCPELSNTKPLRRSSRDLYSARKRSYGVLQDIPEGAALEDETMFEKLNNGNCIKNSTEIRNDIYYTLNKERVAENIKRRRGSSPTFSGAQVTSQNRQGRRTSSPQVMSHYSANTSIPFVRSYPLCDFTGPRAYTVSTPNASVRQNQTERKGSLTPTPPVPCIIIDDHDELALSCSEKKSSELAESKTNHSLQDSRQQTARQTSTGTENTLSSESSCDNLLVQSGDSINWSSSRRKSSLLQEITGPIARRLSALFKTIDIHKGTDHEQELPSNAKKRKLRQRLFGRGSLKETGGESEASDATGEESTSGSSRTSLDKVLVEVVKKDASIVFELLEELEELLQEDQDLSSLVLNDMRSRAEQAMLMTQQTNKNQRRSSLRHIFLGTRDVSFDTIALPKAQGSRRSTFCGSYDCHTGVGGGSDAVYTIPYEGRRKPKSLAHIFNNNDRTAIPMSALNGDDVMAKTEFADQGGPHKELPLSQRNCKGDSQNGEKSAALSHKPLAKCVQIPLADTPQMHADARILSQINNSNDSSGAGNMTETGYAQSDEIKKDIIASSLANAIHPNGLVAEAIVGLSQTTANKRFHPNTSQTIVLSHDISQSPHSAV